MKLRSLIFLVVLALVFVIGPVVNVGAENSTPDYTVQWQDGGTGEPEPVVVVENSPDWNALWNIISVLAGYIGGGGTVFFILTKANKDGSLKESTQSLLASLVPQSALDTLNDMAKGSQQMAHFVVSQLILPGGVPPALAQQIKNAAGLVEQAAEFVDGVIPDGQPSDGAASAAAGALLSRSRQSVPIGGSQQ